MQQYSKRGPGSQMRKLVYILIATGCIASATGMPARVSARGDIEKGSVTFILNCAVCHGMDGKAQGPLADALKVSPVDLTLLAARHNGQFPVAKVSDVIRNGGAVLASRLRGAHFWASCWKNCRKSSRSVVMSSFS
jgi:mono/diheme cytochrome c family protein